MWDKVGENKSDPGKEVREVFRKKDQEVCKGPEAGGNLTVGNGKQVSVLSMQREERQWYQMRLEKRQGRGHVIQHLVVEIWTFS